MFGKKEMPEELKKLMKETFEQELQTLTNTELIAFRALQKVMYPYLAAKHHYINKIGVNSTMKLIDLITTMYCFMEEWDKQQERNKLQ